jgi:hypothetical protein
MPELTGIQLWSMSLAIAGVVVLVVVLLLSLIIRAANRIDRHAREIWEVGKKIAANTVSIWMLEQTNSVAAEILSTAKSIAEGAGAINAKLDAVAKSLGQRGGSS